MFARQHIKSGELFCMDLINIYHCFCDSTRLRILNLLMEGPLCVCHLTEILEVPQPKVSRHLKALRDAGALETERCCNWTICHLPKTPNAVLEANLKCLQDVRGEEAVFHLDLKKRAAMLKRIASASGGELPEQIRKLARACR
jgi:ArsR family transcriptional regulator, arsenate/arsenite/antimonite-responsive transcriptional repressor